MLIYEGVMSQKSFYGDAHLVVAAIRVLEHTEKKPPSVDEVCQTLSISVEQGNLLCNKLHETGAIELTEGAYGTRLFIRDHLKLEEIPKDLEDSDIGEEIEKFKSSKKDMEEKIESIKTEQAEKQKKLFSDIEEKLKKSMQGTSS